MLRIIFLTFVGMFLLSNLGCGKMANPIRQDEPSGFDFDDVSAKATKVYEVNCSGCHSPNSGVNSPITNILDANELLNEEHLFKGVPEISKVYTYLTTDHDSYVSGQISDESLETVYQWISGIEIDETDSFPNVSYSDIQSNLINTNCASCHDANAATPLISEADALFWTIPGNPGASLLFQHTINDHTSPQPDFDQQKMLYYWIAGQSQN